LEKDGQTDEGQQLNRNEDSGQRVARVLVEWNDEVSVLEVFYFGRRLFDVLTAWL
jgi:hypothetical protein